MAKHGEREAFLRDLPFRLWRDRGKMWLEHLGQREIPGSQTGTRCTKRGYPLSTVTVPSWGGGRDCHCRRACREPGSCRDSDGGDFLLLVPPACQVSPTGQEQALEEGTCVLVLPLSSAEPSSLHSYSLQPAIGTGQEQLWDSPGACVWKQSVTGTIWGNTRKGSMEGKT